MPVEKPLRPLIEPPHGPETDASKAKRNGKQPKGGTQLTVKIGRAIVSAISNASSKVEALSPRQIMARGKVVRSETGLADPASLEFIVRP
jgi:hypothetical protein